MYVPKIGLTFGATVFSGVIIAFDQTVVSYYCLLQYHNA